MEALIISVVMGVLENVPKLIEAIQISQSHSEDEKKALLFKLNLALTDATVKVQAVRFRSVSVMVPAPLVRPPDGDTK